MSLIRRHSHQKPSGIGVHILSMAGWLCIPIHQRCLVAISSGAFRLAKSTPPSVGCQYDKSRLSAKRRRPFGCCLVASAHSPTLVGPWRAVPANPDRARRTVSMLCAGRSKAPHAAHGLPAVPRRGRRCAAAPDRMPRVGATLFASSPFSLPWPACFPAVFVRACLPGVGTWSRCGWE